MKKNLTALVAGFALRPVAPIGAPSQGTGVSVATGIAVRDRRGRALPFELDSVPRTPRV